jgi:hypothetical protein
MLIGIHPVLHFLKWSSARSASSFLDEHQIIPDVPQRTANWKLLHWLERVSPCRLSARIHFRGALLLAFSTKLSLQSKVSASGGKSGIFMCFDCIDPLDFTDVTTSY